MSESKGIHGRLAAIMADAKAIGKASRNQQQGFNFRGIDAVMNHLHPVFARHGVVILPEVLAERHEDRQTKSGGNLIYRILTVRFTFAAEDGSSVASTVIGEGMDSGDKAANKAMAVALKYALTQMLLLPYDEVDPDGDTPPPSAPRGLAPAAGKQGWLAVCEKNDALKSAMKGAKMKGADCDALWVRVRPQDSVPTEVQFEALVSEFIAAKTEAERKA